MCVINRPGKGGDEVDLFGSRESGVGDTAPVPVELNCVLFFWRESNLNFNLGQKELEGFM